MSIKKKGSEGSFFFAQKLLFFSSDILSRFTVASPLRSGAVNALGKTLQLQWYCRGRSNF
ncbi:MAG: hypothetical protein OEV88_01220 [Gammaproteobacteria bacterium]|nr:hypothetical protein [Gammaproteobacteria bacterium]